MPSRRAVLMTAGSALAAGCSNSSPSSTSSPTGTPAETPTETSPDSPTATPPATCGEVEVTDIRIESVDGSGNESSDGREQLVVVVESTTDDPPPLVGQIETCDGTSDLQRAVDGAGTHELTFGPYPSDCLNSVELGFEGCGKG